MAHFDDLAPWDYLRIGDPGSVKAVGWLERGRSYSRGDVPDGFVRALSALLVNPWQPAVACGRHPCDLCRFSGGPGVVRIGDTEPGIGQLNLFVPGDGLIYAAPSSIIHYIDAHEYAPPEEFQRAVLACPPMRSVAYLKALRACGLKVDAAR